MHSLVLLTTDTMASQLLSSLQLVVHAALAVVSGEQSWLLAEVHMAFLRLLQMDLEDAYATGAIQASLLLVFLVSLRSQESL